MLRFSVTPDEADALTQAIRARDAAETALDLDGVDPLTGTAFSLGDYAIRGAMGHQHAEIDGD